MAVRKTSTMQDERDEIFLDLIRMLWKVDNLKTLAKDAGVSGSTIHNWLKGPTLRPRIDTLCKVANVLGYSIVLKRNAKMKRLYSIK